MIVGAGLAGLIAGHVFQRMRIMELQDEPAQRHKALLRFRSEAVSKVTGIPFKAVTVRKGIWWAEGFQKPTIQLANLYSQKCLGRIQGDRSIWNIEPVTRYIAPEDFYHQMIDNIGDRIDWGWEVNLGGASAKEPYITTAPLDVTCKQLGIPCEETFARAPIFVHRYRVPDCEAYQTVYFPSSRHDLYRASITGDLLICESMKGARVDTAAAWVEDLNAAFGINLDRCELVDGVKQRYGKIAPINNDVRKSLITRLTTDHHIYSLGRFATWRNLLLDDVLEDTTVIKQIMHAQHYERRLMSL